MAAAILSVVSGCGYYVTVERGDTLYSIAGDYDLTVNDMIEANPDVKNPDRIYVGQKLRIPREKSLAGARSNPPAKETRVASASNDVTPRPAPQEERVEQRDLVEAPPRPAPVAVATPPAGHGQTGDRFVWPVSGKIIAYFRQGTGRPHQRGH
ncbi:MAG: LysM peptidoglycan-binding domain-containing protein [Deltaproteobacteria bacterium]|nr:LysM peptidoglycan-binding domain-containing protein [Deltaproteobacteria bacterium]